MRMNESNEKCGQVGAMTVGTSMSGYQSHESRCAAPRIGIDGANDAGDDGDDNHEEQ